MCELNQANNSEAVTTSLKSFKEQMKNASDRKKQCMHPDELKKIINNNRSGVIQAFQSKRNIEQDYAQDQYKEQLERVIIYLFI